MDEEPVSERAYKAQALLPWNFDSQLALGFAVIKVPLICLVAFIGVFAEQSLKALTQQSWLRYGSGFLLLRTSTGCYAHEVQAHLSKASIMKVGLVDVINKTVLGGHLQGDVWKSNVTLDPLALAHPDTCEVDMTTCRVHSLPHPSFFTGGIDHVIPFALIWFVYKILFIGVHPIDRIAIKIAGDPPPGPEYPEPLMRLITEPYFQFCTTPMNILVKVLCYLRYKLMPNALLGALASMHDMSPQCPRIIYYKMDPWYGTACYFMCIVDLLCIGGAYGLAKRGMNGRLIGRWRYRLWKTLWLVSSILVANFAIGAAIRTFGGFMAVMRAIGSALTMCLKIDFSVHLDLDILRVMTFIIIFLEAVELWFLIISVLGPRFWPVFFEQVPCFNHEPFLYRAVPTESA